ncbi:hypothetical protein Tco_1482685 [Tanacetum coccineum]
MAALKFASSHNMVAFLDKPTERDGFEQIVDFLNAHTIKYALTVNPTVYIACIEQFWATTKVKTVNGEVQIQALVDKKKNLEGGVKFLMYLRKDFSGRDTPLFQTMMVQAQEEGEGSVMPTVPRHTPTINQPSSSQPLKKQKPRKTKKQNTEVSQPSDLTEPMADETKNVESVPTHSNDPLLSGEERLKLNELMELYTNLSQRPLKLQRPRKLQAELEEEERLERQKEEDTNIAEWDNVQAVIDADYEVVARLQAQEQEDLTIEERSKMFMELMDKTKKHFARLKVEEQKRKPPTKAQKRSKMSTYLKHMAEYKQNQLKSKNYDEIQKLFDKAMTRVNMFVVMDTELVKKSTQEGIAV